MGSFPFSLDEPRPLLLAPSPNIKSPYILHALKCALKTDCVNHDILLPKLKFYGISDKDLQLYQSYLGNRCRTAIYNDSKNGNTVSNCANVRHGVPQGAILGLVLFLLYINDLPKIINKISAPIIFADDTSIFFC